MQQGRTEGVTLQRFLDESTAYAGSVVDSTDLRDRKINSDSDSQLPAIDENDHEYNHLSKFFPSLQYKAISTFATSKSEIPQRADRRPDLPSPVIDLTGFETYNPKVEPIISPDIRHFHTKGASTSGVGIDVYYNRYADDNYPEAAAGLWAMRRAKEQDPSPADAAVTGPVEGAGCSLSPLLYSSWEPFFFPLDFPKRDEALQSTI